MEHRNRPGGMNGGSAKRVTTHRLCATPTYVHTKKDAIETVTSKCLQMPMTPLHCWRKTSCEFSHPSFSWRADWWVYVVSSISWLSGIFTEINLLQCIGTFGWRGPHRTPLESSNAGSWGKHIPEYVWSGPAAPLALGCGSEYQETVYHDTCLCVSLLWMQIVHMVGEEWRIRPYLRSTWCGRPGWELLGFTCYKTATGGYFGLWKLDKKELSTDRHPNSLRAWGAVLLRWGGEVVVIS